MSGQTDLDRLLASVRPLLWPRTYVFATLPKDTPLPHGVAPVMSFREAEGTTLILTMEDAAAAALPAIFRCRMITLQVHSSLEAVGFIAAIAARLASAGIGVNPVSGFYHDHLFVPEGRADEAMAILSALDTTAGAGAPAG